MGRYNTQIPGAYRDYQRALYKQQQGFKEYVRSDGFISIETYIDDAMKVFDGFDVNKNQIQKRLMRTTGIGAKNYAKKNFKVLHSRTGKLKKSITYVLGTDGKKVVITNNAESGKLTARREMIRGGTRYGKAQKARYGFMLAHGYTIESKTSKGLIFQIGGKWIRKHKVTVKPKDWIEPPVDRYVDSMELKQRLDAELQRQIDYWEKRLTKA